jgi:hypothetical protein
MKKIFYITFTLVLMTVFASCDPIENRLDSGTVITAAELQATVTPLVVGGKNTNKVRVKCTSPVLCKWTDGVKSYVSNDVDMILFVTGQQTIKLTAKTADGSFITKSFPVTVDKMEFPVEPQYGYLCGPGSKTWTWASTKCFGNGHAYAWDPVNKLPEWWVLSPADVTTQCTEKGKPAEGLGAKMRFTLVDLKHEKISSTGAVLSTGAFSFNMLADSHNWSTGTLTFVGSNILFGYDLNGSLAPWSTYDIMALDSSQLVLGAKGADGTYWYWVFVAN